MSKSLAEVLAFQPEAKQRAFLAKMPAHELEALKYRWNFWARPEQLPPEISYRIWVCLCGRGWGKTKCGSEWIRSEVCGPTPLAAGAGKHQHIGIIAETARDAADVLVDGPAGLLAVHPKDFRPKVVRSPRIKLTWPNGAVATVFNGTEPDQLRGPQHSLLWMDELCKYKYIKETWDMAQFGLRLGDAPKQLITTTPRPLSLLREIEAKFSAPRFIPFDSSIKDKYYG